MSPHTLGILDGNTHTFVGLDLSVHSSGLAYIHDNAVYAETFDATKGIDKDDPLHDGKIRVALKRVIIDFLTKYKPEYVVLEDVFNGATPKVYRQLVNLNNIMDEIILDGTVQTELVRVNNRVWKTWLSSKVPAEYVKYMTDKVRVEVSLAHYGLVRGDVDHKGYQDEFDSIGMALGYYLHTFVDGAVSSDAYAPVTGDNFTRNQLLSALLVSQMLPAGVDDPGVSTDKTKLNRAIRSGLLPFLRFAYDELTASGEKCIHYEGVAMGILCEKLNLQPTLTPTDIYITYKR